ncbi:MAG TPA: PP2C family protein-serine/threonine phosphatase [Vicinamibacterales bacterium]|nr:PP2C family protein-serine/threonine phosphatase [Vicinamibacterales bacterium]
MPRPSFFDQYTQGLTPGDFQKLFTRDTPEAYRYFARHIDIDKLAHEPWYKRWPIHARLIFTAFAMRLSPARRVLYAFAMAALFVGMLQLFRGVGPVRLLLFPFSVNLLAPLWAEGTLWLFLAFAAVNLLVLMEVADRLSLKGDLEIARDIQLAMLPGGLRQAGDAVVCGVTRPANTVGGDFYDILDRPDGRLVIALGDVAGKGSPAALLMALLLAMLRTLVDEGLESARLLARLNVQVARHSPASRFITLFYGLYDPKTGMLQYVNAGHLPPIIRRADGRFERAETPGPGGLALGMFEQAKYDTHVVQINAGDVLVLFSDGITEAENTAGRPFDEAGLEAIVAREAARDPETIGRAILAAVEAHAGDARLADDLTALVLKRNTT